MWYVLLPILGIFFIIKLREMPPLIKKTVVPSDHPVPKSIVWVTDTYHPCIHEFNKFLVQKAGYSVTVIQKQPHHRERDEVVFIPLYETTQVEFMIRHTTVFFATAGSATQVIKTAEQMGKPCCLWATDDGMASLLPLYSQIAVIVSGEWLKAAYAAAPILVLTPQIDWGMFVAGGGERQQVAVFLGGARAAWDTAAVARASPSLQFIDYIPNVTPAKISPNHSQAKLAYFRHEIYSKTRLLLIPVEYPDAPVHAVEALASGIPVIFGSSPALSEIVSDGGVTIPGEDRHASWAAVVEKLMTDTASYELLLRKVGRRSRELRGRLPTVLPFLENMVR